MGAAVAHPFHELPQASTCLGGERVACMTQIVKVDGWEPASFDGPGPGTTAEVAVPQRGAGWTCEDKRVGFGSGELSQMAGQVGHDEVWEGDSAMPGIGFGRAEDLAGAA